MDSRPASLQARLIRTVLGVVTLIWLAAAALTWIDARHEVDELLDVHLAQSAALLLARQFGETGPGETVMDVPGAHDYAPQVMFQVFHAGRLVLRSGDAPRQPVLAPGPAPSRYRTVSLDGVAWRAFSVQDPQRHLQVLVAERLASRQEILWAVLRSTLWPLMLALPLLAAATWWAVLRGMAPIRSLSSAVLARQPQALEPLVVADITRELQPLQASMNNLFERIALLLDAERRFTADAAHELRTPIAAIRIQAQVAAVEADPGRRRHALDATVDGCDRAARLVEQLLTLSRLEAHAGVEQGQVALQELARQVVASLSAKAVSRGQALALVSDGWCPVLGSEPLLSVLLRNLVDNAVRYSPPSARIEVRLATSGGRFELRVEDSGPGLDPEQLARLGERFFRVPGSGASGSGLGWSIARRIAAAHGFALHAGRSAALGGLAVRLEGPCAASAPELAARRGQRAK